MPEENGQKKARGFEQKQKKVLPKPKTKRTGSTRSKAAPNPLKSLKFKNQKMLVIRTTKLKHRPLLFEG